MMSPKSATYPQATPEEVRQLEFDVGPNAPLSTKVVWGGQSGWRVKLRGDLAPKDHTTFSRVHNRAFWDILLAAGVIDQVGG